MEVREAMEKAAEELDAAQEPEPVAAPEPAPVEAAPEPKVETAPKVDERGRAHDEHGRFATKPKEPEKPEAAPEGAKKAEPSKTAAPGQAKAGAVAPVTPPAAAVEKPPEFKAPQSWKPQARDAFAKAPPEVQAEVSRREAEITRTLNETAQARQFAQQTHQAITAYEGVARTRGQDSMTWAGEALQERAVLQAGPLTQRAPILARILSEGGKELIEMVAAHLDGQAPAQAAPPQPVNVQAEVQRYIQAERQQIMASQAEEKVRAFVATAPEYLNDVAQDMIAVLHSASQSNDPAIRNMTPEQAYDRACWMHPDVRARIQAKQAAEAARTPKPVTEQQRRAASSVRSQPAPTPAGKTQGIRAALEKAAEEQGI